MPDKDIELNTWYLKFDELWELIPDKFYKYCSINKRLKENLKKNQLWFNTPNWFNDPFDCKAHLNFGKTEEECRLNYNKFNDFFNVEHTELQSNIWNDLLQVPDDFNTMMSFSAASNFEEWLGVSCFSENYNNTLMWSHYADSHKGILLEFQKSKKGILTKNLLPVNYSEKYPIINVSDYKKTQMMSIAYQVICAKSSSWKYEKEWRAIIVPGPTAYQFKKHELTGVIFGLKVKDNEIKDLQEIINRSDYENISFKQAKLLEKNFSLVYENL